MMNFLVNFVSKENNSKISENIFSSSSQETNARSLFTLTSSKRTKPIRREFSTIRSSKLCIFQGLDYINYTWVEMWERGR